MLWKVCAIIFSNSRKDCDRPSSKVMKDITKIGRTEAALYKVSVIDIPLAISNSAPLVSSNPGVSTKYNFNSSSNTEFMNLVSDYFSCPILNP